MNSDNPALNIYLYVHWKIVKTLVQKQNSTSMVLGELQKNRAVRKHDTLNKLYHKNAWS